MKKTLLLLLALLTEFTSTAVAQKSAADKAAGTYGGQLYIGMGSPVTDETEGSAANIRLEKETESTVKFVLPNFKYGSMSLGDIVLTGIPVYEKESGQIAFSENSPQTLSMMGGMVSAKVNIDHTTSYIDGAYASIDVYVTTRIVSSDVSIYVRFQGENSDYEPEGVAHGMEGARTGTLYCGIVPELTGNDNHSASGVSVTAADANTILLTMQNTEVEGLFIGDVTLSGITVSEKGDGTIALQGGSATGLIMGAVDYTLQLDGAKSYWSTDSLYLAFTITVAGETRYLAFTTGTLPAPAEEVTEGPAAEIAGTYTAGIYVALGEPVTADTPKFTDAQILITAQDSNTVTFTLKDFSLDGVNSIGDIVLKDIPVIDNEDGTYSFGANEPQSVSLAGGAIVADVSIDNATSYVAGDELYVDVPVQAMGETINVHVGKPVERAITGPAAEIAGNYTAGIYVALGEPVTADTPKFTDAQILITAQDENTVTFTLKDFSLDGVNSIGDIVLKDIPVIDNEDGTYSFGANEPQSVSLAGGAIVADVSIDNATSYVAGDELYVDVPVQAMGETINVHVGKPVVSAISTLSISPIGTSAAIYDLSGRRLSQRPTIPGVYIVGGKKTYIH